MRLVVGILALALATAARGELLILDEDDFPQAMPPQPSTPAPAPKIPTEQAKPIEKAIEKAPAKNDQFAAFPGGIVDKDWKKAYIVGVDGMLSAIDLATGKLLWRSAVQAIPLAIDGDRVYALAPGSGNPPALNIVGLSIKGEGKMAYKSDAINTEDWVTTDITNSSLKAASAMEDGKMKLSWSANGMLTTTGVVRPGFRRAIPRSTRAVSAEGSVIIDLQKGTVEEGKSKLSITLGTTLVTQGDVEYRLANEAGKSVVESRDVKTKKTNWQVEVMPANKPAEEMGAAPLQQQLREQMGNPDPGELFVDVQAVEAGQQWLNGDEVFDVIEFAN